MRLFANENALDEALKKAKTSVEAKEIFIAVETRLCPSHWITKARKRYLELCEKEIIS